VLAEALARNNHQIDLVHHKPYLTRERLAEISGTDLKDVRLRLVAVEPYSFGSSHNPLRRYKQAINWQRALSEPYDLFINFTHGLPPFCHAGLGALVVLFPFDVPAHARLAAPRGPGHASWNAFKSAYHRWEWNKRLGSYHIKSAISQFTRNWTTRRWGVDCEVIYPPVDTHFEARAKRNVILSVGRFTLTGHSKKQREMMTAFADLRKQARSEWDYFSIGGVSEAPRDIEYFRGVTHLANKCRGQALANLTRGRLKLLYEQAKVFWHAAGYGEDDSCPELSEHFGIATVEAMSAGCVPVVIDKGGQREIVQHGVNGFLWSTLEELKGYTELLMRDEKLRLAMKRAARDRAANFSREQFVGRFLRLLKDPPVSLG
jgi:glycosyltransferase involved in cell wall biosynthesis